MKINRLVALLLALKSLSILATDQVIDFTNVQKKFSGNYSLLLAGGALKTCSTFALSNCKDPKILQSQAADSKFNEYYQITPQAITLVSASPYFIDVENNIRQSLVVLLQQLAQRFATPMTKSELIEAIEQETKIASVVNGQPELSGQQLLSALSDHNWFLLLDYLQVYQHKNNQRVTETVSLQQSQYYAAPLVFEQFVTMAKAVSNKPDKPTLLVMTSSARDSFEAVDFYQQALQQAGANVHWFPLDLALAKALSENRCEQLEQYRALHLGSVRREFHYPKLWAYQHAHCENPKLLRALLQSADGVFINGGDQSLTLAAFEQSPAWLYELLVEKFNRNELVVGGTSAGAAVQSGGLWGEQPIPMITSGSSYQALVSGAHATAPTKPGCEKDDTCLLHPDSLTYTPTGGLGLISAGIFDTHFSERARQARLIQLAAATAIPFAFGIDEASALQVAEQGDYLFYRVIGASGVWMFELNKLKQSLPKDALKLEQITAHFLSFDDRVIIHRPSGAVKIELAPSKQPFVKPQKMLVEHDVLYRDGFRQLANRLALSQRKEAYGKTRELSPGFRITLRKGEQFANGLGIYQIAGQSVGYLSYINLIVDIIQLGD
ncbi:MAG: cyanophycinase [Gammaproteobacteria bacterium]|nr:cyanophycinase [Gammaproteobacteria bacterium]